MLKGQNKMKGVGEERVGQGIPHLGDWRGKRLLPQGLTSKGVGIFCSLWGNGKCLWWQLEMQVRRQAWQYEGVASSEMESRLTFRGYLGVGIKEMIKALSKAREEGKMCWDWARDI